MKTLMRKRAVMKFAAMLILTTGVSIGALSVHGADQGNNTKNVADRNEAGLKLDLSMPKTIVFGQKILLKISLANKSSQDVTVASLETANITVALTRPSVPVYAKGGEGKPEVVSLNGPRAVSITQPDGKTLIKWVAIPEKKVLLKKASQADRELDVTTLFAGWRLGLGKHTLLVKYEDRLPAEVEFEVVFDLDKTVPSLIGLMKNPTSPDEQIWARNILYIVTGLPGQEDRAKTEAEVERFQEWWAENKGKVELKGERLVIKK